MKTFSKFINEGQNYIISINLSDYMIDQEPRDKNVNILWGSRDDNDIIIAPKKNLIAYLKEIGLEHRIEDIEKE